MIAVALIRDVTGVISALIISNIYIYIADWSKSMRIGCIYRA
jgi:hypothetical protein